MARDNERLSNRIYRLTFEQYRLGIKDYDRMVDTLVQSTPPESTNLEARMKNKEAEIERLLTILNQRITQLTAKP
jgi:hypothetical protein